MVLAAVLAGCHDGGPHLPSGQAWSSTHFIYAARPGDSGACDGVTDRLEAHFALVNAYLGLTWPGGDVHYYKYVDHQDLAAQSDCAPQVDACSGVGTVQSPHTLDGHELIHVYVRHLGRPPPLFEEGLAEALTPQGRIFPAPTESWREVLNAAPLSGGVPAPIAYWGGAWFVSYLLRNQGPAPLLALYAALPRDAGEAEVATTFQQIYGAALDDVWDRARAIEPTEPGVPLWECAADPLSIGGPPADLDNRCDGRGPFAALALDQDSVLTWSSVTLSSGFNLVACEPSRRFFVEQIAWTGALEIGALALPAGKYYLAPTAGTGAVAVSVVPNVLAPTCGAAASMALSAASSNLTLAVANGPDPWFVKLHPAQNPSVTLGREWDDPIVPDLTVAAVDLCTDCSGACQPFDNSVAVLVADGQILRLGGLNAPTGATVVRFSYR